MAENNWEQVLSAGRQIPKRKTAEGSLLLVSSSSSNSSSVTPLPICREEKGMEQKARSVEENALLMEIRGMKGKIFPSNNESDIFRNK